MSSVFCSGCELPLGKGMGTVIWSSSCVCVCVFEYEDLGATKWEALKSKSGKISKKQSLSENRLGCNTPCWCQVGEEVPAFSNDEWQGQGLTGFPMGEGDGSA